MKTKKVAKKEVSLGGKRPLSPAEGGGSGLVVMLEKQCRRRWRLGIWSPLAVARLGFFFTPSPSLLWLPISLFSFSLSRFIVPLLNKYQICF